MNTRFYTRLSYNERRTEYSATDSDKESSALQENNARNAHQALDCRDVGVSGHCVHCTLHERSNVPVRPFGGSLYLGCTPGKFLLIPSL